MTHEHTSHFTEPKGGIELFDEFFESGREESISPFLTPTSRSWGKNLPLKSSFVAAFCLVFSYTSSFFFPQSSLSQLFLLLTYFFAGIPALISAIEDILNFEINIDVLMTLAAFLSILIGSEREGALLLVLFSFSGSLEDMVGSKAKGAISSLKQLSPSKAWIVQADGSLMERSVKDISIGTHIHVKAGQMVPLDGKIIEGSSFLNLAHLTGETHPITRKEGDHVPAGGRNMEGAFTFEVTHTSSDSTLARIIQLIIQAQESKPKLQRWLDKMSQRYAATIILLAGTLALSLPFIFSIPFLGKEGSIYRSLAFLIAASPCALILAIPIAYLSAVSSCAKQGILLKGGMILDELAACKTLALDKTGTLTTGELHCLGIETFEGNKEEMLSIACALERSALHPIAQSITRYGDQLGIKPAPIAHFSSIAGYGLKGEFKGQEVVIGSPEWVLPHLEPTLISKLNEQIHDAKKRGEGLTILKAGTAAALFRFTDTLRPNIRQTLQTLQQKEGLRLVLLSGDHQESVAAVAQEIGITEFFADLRPEDKLSFIAKETHLAMVGDGINDAPALTRASVGISMGKLGSRTAIDASDIVLLQDNIELLGWLFSKAKKTGQIVRQNLVIAVLAIGCATLPALLGWVPLWLAVILHEGGTVVVGLNALRLLKR